MIKGVPPLPPTELDRVDLGSPGDPKNTKNQCKKEGGTEPENKGAEPQSARAGAVETHFGIF